MLRMCWKSGTIIIATYEMLTKYFQNVKNEVIALLYLS